MPSLKCWCSQTCHRHWGMSSWKCSVPSLRQARLYSASRSAKEISSLWVPDLQTRIQSLGTRFHAAGSVPLLTRRCSHVVHMRLCGLMRTPETLNPVVEGSESVTACGAEVARGIVECWQYSFPNEKFESQAATQSLKPWISASPFRCLPMKTMRLLRGDPSSHGFPGSPENSACTPCRNPGSLSYPP